MWILSLSEGSWKPVKYSSQEVPRVHKLCSISALDKPYSRLFEQINCLQSNAHALHFAPLHVTCSKTPAAPQRYIQTLVRPSNSKASAYLQI